jgi:fermentation-respiration switch protein FrsA (DUF1100 family)
VDLEETSPMKAIQHITVPTIFFHGEGDKFVPCEMSQKLFDACTAPKRLVTVPQAGHGACYLKDGKRYVKELSEFFNENL